MATVIAVTSGKGGVGKTNVVTNLGLALAARNVKVCVFDADTGLANINILLGIQPQYGLEQVLDGSMTVSEVMVRVEGGLHVVPAASGVSRCTDLSADKRQLLVEALAELEQCFDYILIDTAAGIDSGVMDFVASAQFRVVVITSEPTSLTDAFALLKMLTIRGAKRNFFALVNRVDGYGASHKVFTRFQQAVAKYLKVDVHFLGYLAEDPALADAVSHQVPVFLRAPDASVSCCFSALADIVKTQFQNEKGLPYFSHYWRKISASNRSKTASKPKKDVITSRQTEAELQLADIYAWLERRDYPEDVMRELLTTVEALYQKKHDKPVKSVDSVLAEFLAGIYRDEAKTRQLHQSIADSFQRRYGKPISDPKAALFEQLQDESISRQEFSNLLQQFGAIYQQRFGVRYFGDGEQLLEKIARLLRHPSDN